VLDIIPADLFTSSFVKEDGERVLDETGKRVI
jgi:arsenate reductase